MSDRYADWLLVVPAAGRLKETATELLRLAGDPSLVRTEGNGTEFLVPPAVAQAFTAPIRRSKPRAPRAEPKSED